MQNQEAIITGRFAPTPSGPLHYGSLVSAVASYCHSKSVNGRWLLRIEDLDTPRVVTGAADSILQTLELYGFEWDGEILYQSQRFDIYEEFLQILIQQNLVYACSCSRKYLQQHPHQTGPLGAIYPGNCRHKQLDFKSLKLRLNIEPAGVIEFSDRHYGTIQQNMDKESGDFIIKRQDGIYAYHLAVVVDDALQKVNDIVRGADLLEASFIHIYLNSLLGFSSAEYLHVPLIKNKTGEKLSKQSGAEGLTLDNPGKQLVKALVFLGQNIPTELSSYKPADILHYAIEHWDSRKIPN
ncbi:MAG: tRNA glutamyl-Q(34) synthetase GluQRS [Gammaproteobacteria bacterium]|nr:tRNA glutamyl-Q(34) synthetase GluQRS [Gammaproteobacteria bacterium]